MPRRPKIESFVQSIAPASQPCRQSLDDDPEIDERAHSRGYLISASLPSEHGSSSRSSSGGTDSRPVDGSVKSRLKCSRSSSAARINYRPLQQAVTISGNAESHVGVDSELADVMGTLDTSQMRFFFLLLDVILLCHRFWRAYSNCRALSRNGSARKHNGNVRGDETSSTTLATPAAAVTRYTNGTQQLQHDVELQTSSHYLDSDQQTIQHRSKLGRLGSGLFNALTSESMPLMVFASFGLLILFVLVHFCNSVIDIQFMTDSNIWRTNLQGPSYIANFTNALIKQQADYFDGDVLSSHGLKTASELLQLQSTLTTVNGGQDFSKILNNLIILIIN